MKSCFVSDFMGHIQCGVLGTKTLVFFITMDFLMGGWHRLYFKGVTSGVPFSDQKSCLSLKALVFHSIRGLPASSNGVTVHPVVQMRTQPP
jgi:hypothetical protein